MSSPYFPSSPSPTKITTTTTPFNSFSPFYPYPTKNNPPRHQTAHFTNNSPHWSISSLNRQRQQQQNHQQHKRTQSRRESWSESTRTLVQQRCNDSCPSPIIARVHHHHPNPPLCVRNNSDPATTNHHIVVAPPSPPPSRSPKHDPNNILRPKNTIIDAYFHVFLFSLMSTVLLVGKN